MYGTKPSMLLQMEMSRKRTLQPEMGAGFPFFAFFSFFSFFMGPIFTFAKHIEGCLLRLCKNWKEFLKL